MADINFVDGLRVSKPKDGAPDFVKATFGAKVDDLVAWLQKNVNEKGWVNFDLKESTAGKLYCAINDYKKDETTPPVATEDGVPVVDEDAPQKIDPANVPF